MFYPHAHSLQYAHKLVTTKRAIENRNAPHCQALEPGAFIPSDPHKPPLFLLCGGGDERLF
eukprot:1058340-Pelagomonas_calceolata.AAC.1